MATQTISRLEKDEQFFLVAEVDKKVVASSDFQIQGGTEEHSGEIGIAVRDGYRNLGIGTEIMKTLLEQAASLDFGHDSENSSPPTNGQFTFTRRLVLFRRAGFRKAF